uniref:Uncharacterized protein n=1 Tax=Pyxicephalus adspersus TaxID=30357 RepID=A0AAV3AKW5_PYXAD|nr:TPA: hypothetical protein GDO54_014533 [Pyxicephalus adspersus]
MEIQLRKESGYVHTSDYSNPIIVSGLITDENLVVYIARRPSWWIHGRRMILTKVKGRERSRVPLHRSYPSLLHRAELHCMYITHSYIVQFFVNGQKTKYCMLYADLKVQPYKKDRKVKNTVLCQSFLFTPK